MEGRLFPVALILTARTKDAKTQAINNHHVQSLLPVTELPKHIHKRAD